MNPANVHRRHVIATTTLALLLAAYVLAFAQRQLPAALAPLVVARFGISDAALGALHGSSFAVAYGYSPSSVDGWWIEALAPPSSR